MRDYIYDIESYPNIFTLAGKHHITSTRYRFEISHRRNDRFALLTWLRWLHENKCRMVGYNNDGFDYPVLDFILNYPDMGAAEINRHVQALIGNNDRWGNAIRNPWIEQIDLYKIHDFDRETKRTSLKALEFNMRRKTVVDLPFPPGTWLSDSQMDTLIVYNDEDVDATDDFYGYSLDQIHFRERLTAKYGGKFQCMNWNDVKIGKEYFIMELEKASPGICYIPGTRKPRQTIRPQIDLSEVVFPWIQFKRPAFTAVTEWFKRQVITETKGVFNDISEESLGADLVQYCTLKKHRQALVPGIVTPSNSTVETTKNGKTLYAVWNKAENLHVIVNGFQFDFGTGGIHGSVSSRVVLADNEYGIYDIDVKSYYPNLGIKNRIYPEHLGENFCGIYSDVYDMRQTYPKSAAENGMLKLSLNSVYGQSNAEFSPFRDPKYTMLITVNGQLLLCLAADYLMDIPGLEIIQVNTDGLTVRCPRNMKWAVDRVCEWWQEHTRLELEEVEYRGMWIRDVNNYIAQTVKGKVKRKGAYAHKFEPPHIDKGSGDLEWHQDHSALVVPKAAEAALVRGEDIVQFIMNHQDPFDFCLRAKVPKNCRLLINESQVQNITRYYVVHSGGGEMIKVMPPLPKAPDKERRIGIEKGRKVRDANDIDTFDRSLIDYGYYIAEAEKLVKPLLGGN